MKKTKGLKALINMKLIIIYRGFLTDDMNKTVTDKEVLSYIPPDALTRGPDGNFIQRPFTKQWVTKFLKKDPEMTVKAMLATVGFNDA